MPKGHPGEFVYLSGQKFWNWTVLSFAYMDRKQRLHWKVRCDCGNLRTRTQSKIVNGTSKKCRSCLSTEQERFNDYSGMKIGVWDVVAVDHIGSEYVRRWRAICECGKEQVVTGTTLRNNPRAGCRSCILMRKSRSLGRIWSQIVASARARDMEMTIDRDFAHDLLVSQNYRCALTGFPLEINISHKDYLKYGNTASLDRIDSSRGYTPDNVQWVHKDVNQLKMDLTEDRLLELCKAVVTHSRSKLRARGLVDSCPLFDRPVNLQV